MGRKYDKKENDPLLSLTPKDNYTYIYDGTLTSKQFTNMSPTAQRLYFACISQRMSGTGKANLHLFNAQHGTDYNEQDGYFTMPNKRIEDYGLKPNTCHKTSFKELVDAGFIEVAENNKHRKIENIYRLIKDWKKEK